MPAEAQRLRRRLTRRDRWFLVLLLVAVLAGTPAAVLLARHGSQPGVDDGCVTTMRASIMGGATYRYCGAQRAAACRQFASDDKALAARCRALGYLRRP